MNVVVIDGIEVDADYGFDVINKSGGVVNFKDIEEAREACRRCNGVIKYKMAKRAE